MDTSDTIESITSSNNNNNNFEYSNLFNTRILFHKILITKQKHIQPDQMILMPVMV